MLHGAPFFDFAVVGFADATLRSVSFMDLLKADSPLVMAFPPKNHQKITALRIGQADLGRGGVRF